MENKILNSLAKVNEELFAIEKDQQGYGYKFRGINQVLNALHPLFKKYKIVTRREIIDIDRQVRFVESKKKEFVEVFIKCDYIFTSLEDGSELRTQGFGEGQDTSGGDKAAAMATSNAYKYVIFELFNIATEDQKDSDQVTAEVNGVGNSKFTKDAKKAGKNFRKVKQEDDII